MNLVKCVEAIEAQIKEEVCNKEIAIKDLNTYYDTKLRELESAFKIITKMNATCLVCKGARGWNEDVAWITCANCNGTGLK